MTADPHDKELPDAYEIARLTSTHLTHTQALTIRWLIIQERNFVAQGSVQRHGAPPPSLKKEKPFTLRTLRVLEDLGLIESFDFRENKRTTRSNGRSVIPTGHVRKVTVTRWRLTAKAKKLLAPVLPRPTKATLTKEVTLVEAQEHVALVRGQNDLAHQIAAALAKNGHAVPPASLIRLAQTYKANAEKIAKFEARAG